LEVVRLKDDGHEVLLVSSGAVAAGYRKLGCLDRPTELAEKQAAASIGQGLLMEAYSERFNSHGYTASQILITRSDFSDRHRYENARNTLNVLLERGIIPIINENDTVTIARLKFGDNDTLSAKIAGLVNGDQLLILSDIDGLYDDNPRNNPDAKLLEQVYEITPEIENAAGGAGSDVGTGGMRSKIEAVNIAMAYEIPAFLGNSTTPNIIYDAVHSSAKGTYFDQKEALPLDLNDKKCWIAFNSGPEGELIVNEKGNTAIAEHENSLLPKGIDYVKGHFKKGAVVKLTTMDGEDIGLGVTNFSSKQLKQLKGHETDQITEITDEKEKEAVSKSDLVFLDKLALPNN
jgi:glutamate 5-kinase